MKIRVTDSKDFIVTDELVLALDEVVSIKPHPKGIIIKTNFNKYKIVGIDAKEIWEWFQREEL